jgi:UDP-glucose 4-epimerase
MNKDKKVLVIGGAGFIGSNLVKELIKLGYSVSVLDNLSTGSRDNFVVGADYTISDASNIKNAFGERSFKFVFHFGEYPRVEQSFEDIDECFGNNTASFPAVLSYCRQTNSKLIYSASSTVFNGKDEDGEWLSPYTLSKAFNVNLLLQYSKWKNLDFAIVYFYNVYGPGEISSGKYSTVIAKYLQLLSEGQLVLPVTAPGTQRRNFTHVNDIVSGLLLLATKGRGDGYGIGTDESYSILEIIKILGADFILTPHVLGNRMGAPVQSNKTKALGWSPKHQLIDYLSNSKQRFDNS